MSALALSTSWVLAGQSLLERTQHERGHLILVLIHPLLCCTFEFPSWPFSAEACCDPDTQTTRQHKHPNVNHIVLFNLVTDFRKCGNCYHSLRTVFFVAWCVSNAHCKKRLSEQNRLSNLSTSTEIFTPHVFLSWHSCKIIPRTVFVASVRTYACTTCVAGLEYCCHLLHGHFFPAAWQSLLKRTHVWAADAVVLVLSRHFFVHLYICDSSWSSGADTAVQGLVSSTQHRVQEIRDLTLPLCT